jgi:hypothetical protein
MTADPDGQRPWLRRAPLLLVLCLLAVHVAPLWADLSGPSGWDTRYVWFIIEVDRTTIAEYHQVPLWNPYYCGGAPHIGSPQTGTFSPLTLPIVLLGTPIGYRVGYTLGLLAALLCMRAFCRTLGLSELAATVAGGAFAFCGAFAQHMGGGHWVWIAFAFYPLMLRSLHLVLAGQREHIVWGGAVLTMIIFHWPIYPLAFALVTVSLYALYLGLQNGVRDRRRLATALLAAAAMIGLGLALGAIRLAPVAEHISAHPRKVKDRDYTWPYELFETYAGRHLARGFGNHQYVFPEFGNYISPVGVALMFFGLYLVVRRRRSLVPIVVSGVTFVLFQLGNLIPLPWWWLKKVPVYENLRVPSRFTVIAGLFMCVLIGVAVDEWGAPALARWRSLDRRARRVGLLVLVLSAAMLIDEVSFNRLQWNQTFGAPPQTEPRAAQFHQAPGNAGRMYVYPQANQGSLNCFEETPLPISPRLRANLPADEYLQEPDAGSVRRVRWSPNRIELDVDLRRPAIVLVNQNFGPGWRVSGGTVTNEGGLLGARVPQGRHQVTFRYLPRGFIVGGAISLLAALAAAIFVIVVRRRRANGSSLQMVAEAGQQL